MHRGRLVAWEEELQPPADKEDQEGRDQGQSRPPASVER